MSDESVDQFAKDLESLIERSRQELDLTYASAIGVLMLAVYDLQREKTGDDDH